ncbi:MAG: hypothetical protein AB8B91_16580 [Rubripirellula sp.]
MTRVLFGLFFAGSLSLFSIGCGDGGADVIQDSRTQSEVEAEDEEYERELEEAEKDDEGEQ